MKKWKALQAELHRLNQAVDHHLVGKKKTDRTPVHIRTRKTIGASLGVALAVAVNGFIVVYADKELTVIADYDAKEGFVPLNKWEAYKKAFPQSLEGVKPAVWEVQESK